jgi:hypothetical protein
MQPHNARDRLLAVSMFSPQVKVPLTRGGHGHHRWIGDAMVHPQLGMRAGDAVVAAAPVGAQRIHVIFERQLSVERGAQLHQRPGRCSICSARPTSDRKFSCRNGIFVRIFDERRHR